MGDRELENLLLRFSESSGIQSFMVQFQWGWPIAEILHFTGLCLLFGSIGLFDLRVLGWGRSIPLASLHKLVPIGVGGFLLNVCTGIMFVTCVPDQYLYNPAFQTKMALILLAGVNMLLFYRLAATQLWALPAGAPARLPARVFTLVSLLAWLGVMAGGRLITFYRPPWYWCFWC